MLLNRRRVLLPRVTRDGTLCAPAWLCCHCLAAICCRLLPTLSLSASLATGKSNPRDQTFAPNVPRKECQQAKEPKVALALPKARSSIRLTLSCSFLPHSAVCCSFYRVASISGWKKNIWSKARFYLSNVFMFTSPNTTAAFLLPEPFWPHMAGLCSVLMFAAKL